MTFLIFRLKLGDDLQYVLNPRGSSPSDVMGLDYKNILKPSLVALSEDTKKGPVAKLEELRALKQQLCENAVMLEEKKVSLADLQAKVAEVCPQCLLSFISVSISSLFFFSSTITTN